MKVNIKGIEFEGTPEEINELINLHGYKNILKDESSRVNKFRPANLFKVGDYDFYDSPKCSVIS